MDEWGVDALVTGSQKALMLPPGLAMVALSKRALERAQHSRTPRFYFDLMRELKAQRDEHTTAWTAAVSLVLGLNKSLEMIHAEGLPQVFARHRLMARGDARGRAGFGPGPARARQSRTGRDRNSHAGRARRIEAGALHARRVGRVGAGRAGSDERQAGARRPHGISEPLRHADCGGGAGDGAQASRPPFRAWRGRGRGRAPHRARGPERTLWRRRRCACC